MTNEQFLVDGLTKLNINIDETTINKFILYKELMQEWNEKINLTAITEDKDIITKHFIDSATIIETILNKHSKSEEISLIDVGTGAGFPGIVVKLLLPNVKVVLMDSLNKRIKFLNDIIEKLELENISCVHMRAEDAGRNINFRHKFDIVCARAVSNLSVLSEYCLPLAKVYGCFIAMKGSEYEQEMENAKNAIALLGGKVFDSKYVILPYSDIKHSIIVIEKFRQTPEKYPRISALISKTAL